ncbi:JAB domain-containing protein [Chryseolinea sp. H1M3-3]|uniref:JAB domain-containing protein n=1 Tax=Chryseolinea sp. H1M3-3 TaxID=3034144 RepID=UPI0023EBB347|nr:JAB domain-containing protein [Chryseolinea sp. H1M3-3]
MESTNEKTLFEVSEIQLSYKSKVKSSLRPKISSSRDAENIFRQYWNDDVIELQEEFKMMLLNRYNKVIGIFTVSQGGIAGTVADPKLIFGCALKAAASGIILVHNHPSGSLRASDADIKLTKKLKDGGNLLDIQVLDHIIITSEAYFSFADEGLL